MGHLRILLFMTSIGKLSIADYVNTAMEHLPYLDNNVTEEYFNMKDLANINILDILGDYLTPV